MITSQPHLHVRLATSEQDYLSAARLRYEVFVRELGGDGPLVEHERCVERDHYDPFAEHLVLVDSRRDPMALDHVVGVYRLLSADGADRAGQFYSETEYDLSVLHQSGRKLLELGRSCIHPDYRGGLALFALWNGLAHHVRSHGYEVLFGVASFHGTDASLYAPHFSYLQQNHLTPDSLLVTARSPNHLKMNILPAADIDRLAVMRTMPPLIKAYLRIGGFVGDGAFIDWQFNTTDVCLVVDAVQLAPDRRARYGSAG